LEAAAGLKLWLSSDPAAAVEENQWFDVAGGFGAIESEILFRYLGKMPGWNEKNFQVSIQVYEVMTLTARESPSFGKSSAAQVIGSLTDKLGDIKLKRPAGEALTTFAEKTSLGFVLSQGMQ
jgi:cytoskeleton-associated protein 5